MHECGSIVSKLCHGSCSEHLAHAIIEVAYKSSANASDLGNVNDKKKKESGLAIDDVDGNDDDIDLHHIIVLKPDTGLCDHACAVCIDAGRRVGRWVGRQVDG